MEVAFLLGRTVLGVCYLFNAFNHLTRLEMLSGYAASRRVPAPKPANEAEHADRLLLLVPACPEAAPAV